MRNIPKYRIKIKRQHILYPSPYSYTEYVSDDWSGEHTHKITRFAPSYLNYWSENGRYRLLDVKFAVTPVIFIQIYGK